MNIKDMNPKMIKEMDILENYLFERNDSQLNEFVNVFRDYFWNAVSTDAVICIGKRNKIAFSINLRSYINMGVTLGSYNEEPLFYFVDVNSSKNNMVCMINIAHIKNVIVIENIVNEISFSYGKSDYKIMFKNKKSFKTT